MVVWSDALKGGRIYGARVSKTGKVLDRAGIKISSDNKSYQNMPSIIFDGKKFLVVWATPKGIDGRFIDANGTPGKAVVIYSQAASIYALRIAFDGSNFLVVWYESSKGNKIKGQLVSRTGDFVGELFEIPVTTRNAGLGICFDGNSYIVTWSDDQISGQRINKKGKLSGAQFKISDSKSTQYYCDIAASPNRRYLNVWAENSNIFGNIDLKAQSTE